MLFHQAHVFVGTDIIHRQDVSKLDPVSQATAEHYRGRIGRGADLDAVFDVTSVQGKAIHYSRYGAMICQYDMPRIVGAACLFLAGKVPTVDAKHCKIFQEAVGSFASQWKIPEPPMEFDSRPLFFYVLFNLDGGDVWKSAAMELVQRANGVGTAFLQQLNQ